MGTQSYMRGTTSIRNRRVKVEGAEAAAFKGGTDWGLRSIPAGFDRAGSDGQGGVWWRVADAAAYPPVSIERQERCRPTPTGADAAAHPPV